MSYLAIKYIHIISMLLLVGTGLGSAFYKWMADRNGNISLIVSTNRHVVYADWFFTTPAIIVQPLSGLYLAYMLDISIATDWLLVSLLLYVLAGICWIPVVWLQIKMHKLAVWADSAQQSLPPLYWRYVKIWTGLGIPAFLSMLAIIFLMIFKPLIWS